MSEKKYKNTQIGTMWKGPNGRQFIKLGDVNNPKEKYRFEVQILVKNSQGEKVAVLKNPYINLYDPRNNEKRQNVPEKLMFELSVSEEVNE